EAAGPVAVAEGEAGVLGEGEVHVVHARVAGDGEAVARGEVEVDLRVGVEEVEAVRDEVLGLAERGEERLERRAPERDEPRALRPAEAVRPLDARARGEEADAHAPVERVPVAVAV